MLAQASFIGLGGTATVPRRSVRLVPLRADHQETTGIKDTARRLILRVHEGLDRVDAHHVERPGDEQLNRRPADATTAGVANEPIPEIRDLWPPKHERDAADGRGSAGVFDRERQPLSSFTALPLTFDERQTLLIRKGIWESRSGEKVSVCRSFTNERQVLSRRATSPATSGGSGYEITPRTYAMNARALRVYSRTLAQATASALASLAIEPEREVDEPTRTPVSKAK
jgi:hypothetical protein